jgi:hypothetical protein
MMGGHKSNWLQFLVCSYITLGVYVTENDFHTQIILNTSEDLTFYFEISCRIWGFHSSGYEEYHLLGYDAV